MSRYFVLFMILKKPLPEEHPRDHRKCRTCRHWSAIAAKIRHSRARGRCNWPARRQNRSATWRPVTAAQSAGRDRWPPAATATRPARPSRPRPIAEGPSS